MNWAVAGQFGIEIDIKLEQHNFLWSQPLDHVSESPPTVSLKIGQYIGEPTICQTSKKSFQSIRLISLIKLKDGGRTWFIMTNLSAKRVFL